MFKTVVSYIKGNKWSIAIILVLAVVTAISSFQLKKTLDVVESKDSKINELSETTENLKKTICTLTNTSRTRKEYDESGRLRAEEYTETAIKEDVNELKVTLLKSEIEKVEKENSELHKKLDISPKAVKWGIGAKAGRFTDPLDVSDVWLTHKFVKILGMEAWGGATYAFDEKVVGPCVELKF